MSRVTKIFSFALLAFLLGASAGVAIWTILRIMNALIDLLWVSVPDALGFTSSPAYNLALCLAGGLIIGLFQKKHGILPDNMEQVMGRVKRDHFYPYDRLHIIAAAALLPLIFGGALGPEAGLTGIIVGLCYFIGDKLKYKADEAAMLAESGTAAVLGIVFGAPLFGIVGNLEPESWSRHERKRLAGKKTRLVIYIAGVAGGVLVMAALGRLFGGSSGLPHFVAHHEVGFGQWKWFPVLILTGVIFGIFYMLVKKITDKIGELLSSHRVASCMLAGAAVALIGYVLPLTMFSGEHQMGELMNEWQSYPVAILICSAVGKIVLVNICISCGWKGGNIFPLIFSGVAVGYAAAAVVGMDGALAVAVTAAALYGYIMRKPLTVAAVLLLCFPVTYIVPILISSFISSKIPARLPSSFRRSSKRSSE